MIQKNQAAARAIVIHNNHLLVIKRIKKGMRYMVTPGGRIEARETKEQALIRELAEETMIKVANPRLVFIENPNDDNWGIQYIYLCDYVSGEPQLHPDSEEVTIQGKGWGTYQPMWVPLKSLPDKDYRFLSVRLGEEILSGTKNGFPSSPKKWIL